MQEDEEAVSADFDMAQVQLTLARAGIAIWKIDLAAELVTVCASFELLTGAKPSSKVEFLSLFDPLSRQALSFHIGGAASFDTRVHLAGASHKALRIRGGLSAGAVLGVLEDDEVKVTAAAPDAMSSERMQLALDAGAVVVMWIWDVQNDIVVADELFARTFGVDPQACKRGVRLSELMDPIHPEDVQRVRAAIAAAVDRGGPYRCEYRIRKRGGDYGWIEANGRVELDASGQAVRFPGVLLDIAERRKAEAERDRVTGLLRSFIEAVPGVVYGKFRDGRMFMANKGTAELVGLPLEDIIGRTDMEFLRDKEQARVIMENDARIMSCARTELCQERVDRPDGQVSHWLSCKAPFLDDAGDVVGLIGASIDITDRVAMESELRERERELQEQDRRKDQFLATLAHELRNPLAPISNGLAILRRTGAIPDSGPAARAVAMMERQLDQIVHLVEDLLDVARINQDKISLRLEHLTAQEVVSAAVEAARPAIESGQHALGVNLPGEPLGLLGDRTRLVQVVTNLLINAAKYSEPGGHIRVTALECGKQICIEVQDRGLGISPDVLPRIWTMFSQNHDAHKNFKGGLGIGLALAKKLAELHSGAVSASSAGAGQGSTFRVELPRTRAAAAPQTSPQDGAGEHTSSLHVLVVDDTPDVAHSLAALLELLGHRTLVALEGAQALTLTAQQHFDVVFCDIGMPGISGLDVARTIKARTGHRPVLVAISGWGAQADRERSQAAGFDAHLTKPANLRQLSSLLSRVAAKAPAPG